MSAYRVVVLSNRPFNEQNPVVRTLADLDAEVLPCLPDDSATFAQIAPEADAFVFSGGFSAAMFAQAPKCKIVARDGVGYDTVDVAEATRRGVWVTIIPDALVDDVADTAMALVLSVNRRIPWLDAETRRGHWRQVGMEFRQRPPLKLRDRTIGVVGLGRIGRGVAERAKGFGLNIIAYDPMVSAELAQSVSAELVSLDELLGRADFVSLNLPLLDSTFHLIGAREIGLMKPSAVLINTARGPIVDEQALVSALKEGRIAGAGLDVYEQEPAGADNPLMALPNVVVTPHIASTSDVSNYERQAEAAGEVLRVLTNGKPRQQATVNRDLFQKS